MKSTGVVNILRSWSRRARLTLAAAAVGVAATSLVGTAAMAAPAGTTAAVVPSSVGPLTAAQARSRLTPIVLFPAYTYTRLRVKVSGQTTDPACPTSGTFEVLAGDTSASAFSSVCKDELITLRYRSGSRLPMAKRFTEQRGVTTSIPATARPAAHRSTRRSTRPSRSPATSATVPSGWPATTSA